MGIYIRFRKGANGNFSAYLDSYHKGKRSNTYTDIVVTEDYSKPILDRSGNPKKNEKGLLIYPKVKPEDKEKMEILERLKLEKEIEVASNKFTVIKREKRVSVVSYLKEVAKSKKSPQTYLNHIPLITEFIGPEFPLQEFTEKHLRDYFTFLRNKGYAPNTVQMLYFGINAMLNQAVRDKIIPTNPKSFLARHEIPSGNESNRQHLTAEELRKLIETEYPHKNKQMFDAFLFACLTGLRISDLTRITHSDVVEGVLQFRQKKSSKKFHYLPLSKQAQSILATIEKNPLNECIFWNLPKPAQGATKYLQQWANKAGINKHITWHVARHTYATVLLNEGVDLFTISKLLGHYSVNTTQIYGKVMTKTKLDAIEKFPSIF